MNYVTAEAAGPLVDVTVWGGLKTASLPPDEARKLARDLTKAAEAIEHPPSDHEPELHIVLEASR